MSAAFSPSVSRGHHLVLLSAFGIHTGGGKVLLDALRPQLHGLLKLAALDSRLPATADDESTPVLRVHRSFVARVVALNTLARACAKDDVLFCFNSLPPLIKVSGRVIVYVHAPHFAGLNRGIRYSRVTAARIAMEVLWFRWGIRNADEIWVQTESMARALSARVPKIPVKIVPFVDDVLARQLALARDDDRASRRRTAAKNAAYFFPAEAVGHKNHERLLQAWRLLAQQLGESCPRLHLTLAATAYDALLTRCQLEHDVRSHVHNLGPLSREQVLAEMHRSAGLIFPSLAETFGLPLLEAKALRVPILAPERDYVRDVVTPSETFDAESAVSISRAVCRHVGALGNEAVYLDAASLIERILR